MTKRKIIIVLFLIFSFSLNSHSGSVIGKITSSINGNKQVHPLLTDETQKFNSDSKLTVRGGKFLISNGTLLKVTEFEDRLVFHIDKGQIKFQIFPEKVKIVFQTPQGEIATPSIVNASLNSIEGELVVKDNDTTILQVNQGNLDVLTQTGVVNL